MFRGKIRTRTEQSLQTSSRPRSPIGFSNLSLCNSNACRYRRLFAKYQSCSRRPRNQESFILWTLKIPLRAYIGLLSICCDFTRPSNKHRIMSSRRGETPSKTTAGVQILMYYAVFAERSVGIQAQGIFKTRTHLNVRVCT